jgi:hypothetical protein
MKKRILTLALALTLILALVPMAPAAVAAATYVEVIPPKYDEVKNFSEGLAAVCVGNWIDEDVFYSDGEFAGTVKRLVNQKWGFIDKTGAVVIPLIYDTAYSFSDGVAEVWLDGEWGFIDKTGSTVERRLVVGRLPEGLTVFWCNDTYKLGYRDEAGNIVIAPAFDDARNFSDGLAAVQLDGKWGFIDRTGKEIIAPAFDQARDFSDGLAVVQRDWRWGIIDKTGNEIVPSIYFWIRDFSEGLAVVHRSNNRHEDVFGFIDKTGTEVITPIYWSAGDFSEGIAAVATSTRNNNTGDWVQKFGFIDSTGREIVPLQFDNAERVSEGMAAVAVGEWLPSHFGPVYFAGKWGFIAISAPADPLSTASPWAHTYINTALDHGIIPESLQNHYRNNTTRAEFCALAVALIETLTGKEITERRVFADDGGDINIRKIGGLGIVTGTGYNAAGDRLFSPNNPIERQAAALILARVADIGLGKSLPDGEHTFADIGSSFAIDAIRQMRGGDIMRGKSVTSFAPRDSFTREESIITMVRMWNWFNR